MLHNGLRALVLLAAVAVAMPAAAQDELSKGDKEWMEEEVGALITEQEKAIFQEIDKDDRKLFKELFWTRRDFNPTTSENEFRKGFEQRVEVADENFKVRGRDGSRTDMGQLFVLLGAPDSQEQGRPTGGIDPLQSEPGGGGAGEDPGGAGPGTGLGTDVGGDLGGARTLTWVYQPKPELGLPDGLAATFRNQPNFGYRLMERDEIEEKLERVKERLVANPAVNYALDESGRLRELDDRYDPNSAPKQLLGALQQTGETSSAIQFEVHPMFFRSSEGQVYIPMDFVVSEGLQGEDATVFGGVENADGLTTYQFEEPAKFEEAERGHLAFEIPLQLAPGLYTLYLGILDSGGQVHGTKIVDLEVPDFDAEGLKLSSILMFSEGTQTGDATGVPGKAFKLGGYHFTPKREMVYTKSDQLAGVFNAYNFGLDNGKPDLSVQVVFSKDGQRRGQTKEEPFMLQTAEMALTIFDIPLNIPNFADAGEFKLEVRVKDNVKNETLREEISFVIEE